MRRTVLAVFLVLLLSVLFSADLDSAQQYLQASGPTLVVPGASLAGIRIGESAARVVARFGPPDATTNSGERTSYTFWRYAITVYIRDGVVAGILTTNSLLRTGKGIGMGSSLEEVIEAYGSGTSGMIAWYRGIAYPDLGIAFGMERGAVVSVYVFQGPVDPAGIWWSLPDISGLRPFTGETRHLSLPGYLRYLVHEHTGIWISYAEADRIVRDLLSQKRTAGD